MQLEVARAKRLEAWNAYLSLKNNGASSPTLTEAMAIVQRLDKEFHKQEWNLNGGKDDPGDG